MNRKEVNELDVSLFKEDLDIFKNQLLIDLLEIENEHKEQRIKELNFIRFCHTGKFLG